MYISVDRAANTVTQEWWRYSSWRVRGSN